MTEFGNGKKKNDLGFLNFDLETDLTPLFNWNVKQLFLYLTAEYKTKQNVIIRTNFKSADRGAEIDQTLSL